MSLTLTQSVTAIGPTLNAYFLAIGGSSPYVYSVRAGGAGGSIDASSGMYTAPSAMPEDPNQITDTIQVRDNSGAVATAQILIGTPLLLVCDIIQHEMGLDSNHIYLWDQKIMQPTDDGLYVAVSLPQCKPFGNNITYVGNNGFQALQSVNMMGILDIDIISRGPAARDQKELVLMSLMSQYSETQQEANSFHISRLPNGSHFINLSEVDGAAIPYRYKISMGFQYLVNRTVDVPYFNQFQSPTVVVNS